MMLKSTRVAISLDAAGIGWIAAELYPQWHRKTQDIGAIERP
jgi:hypothetical protein